MELGPIPQQTADAVISNLSSLFSKEDDLSDKELGDLYLTNQRRNLVIRLSESQLQLQTAEQELKEILDKKNKTDDDKKKQEELGNQIATISRNIRAYTLRMQELCKLIEEDFVSTIVTYDQSKKAKK